MPTEIDEAANLKKQITIHQRRLNILKEKKAMMGFTADPAIIIEIEDIEKELERLRHQLELKDSLKTFPDKPYSPDQVDTAHRTFQESHHPEEKQPSSGPKITGIDANEIHNSEIDITQKIGEVVGRDKNTTNIYMGTPDSQEQKFAQDRYEETILQSYLDKMAELLLPPNNLRSSPEDSEVRNIARTRTLTVLRGLNAERKGFVVQFLYESHLISREKVIIPLRGADLAGIHLPQVVLPEINLNRANLSGANLEGAILEKAQLLGATLSGANLKGTNLSEANLEGAILNGASHDSTTRWPTGFIPPTPALPE